MPSIKMKTKLSPSCLSEKNGLRVCQSSMISKKTYSDVQISERLAEIDSCTQKRQDFSLSMQVSVDGSIRDEVLDCKEFLDEEISLLQRQPSISINSSVLGRMDTDACLSDTETVFSPILENIEILTEPNTDSDAAGRNNGPQQGFGTDDSDDKRSSLEYQTCDVSDFYISDMIIASLPLNGSDDFCDLNYYIQNYRYSEPLFHIPDQYMFLPFLEDTVNVSDSCNAKTCEGALTDTANASFYIGIEQMKPSSQEVDVSFDSDHTECFDPQLFIKNIPELTDVVSNFQPNLLPKESQRRKSVTLVLDLDETLVHTTMEHCNDKDFSFSVFFNMKEHIVCVKKRPYLHLFLERVAEMFEVFIFTASQSIYAEQVLNVLDPEGRLISRRVYRESCIFSDGNYTKDLTVLGIDLAKVVIIDNNPQVFRLQVNNGIPIKSWFDDPSDTALLSLLPFLETLVDADDVRPVIAQRFGNKAFH